MTLGRAGMTGALVFVAKSGQGTSTSGGKVADLQMLNNRSQEDVSTSRNNLCPDRWDAVLKTATLSFRDERKRMKWPRRRTP
jgi:hypothetical protein